MSTAHSPTELHPTAQYASTRSRVGEPTWEIALLYPKQGQWSESAYLNLTHSNWMVEFKDGRIEVLPTPTLYHQLILDFLLDALKRYIREHADGRALMSPMPVRLSSGKQYREPDIVYLSSERLQATDKYPAGADLVMEIVSEGDEARERDLVEKRKDYAAGGITEYWIVDPQQREIHVLALDGETYREHGVFTDGQTASSVMFAGFSVNVRDVFDVLPNPPGTNPKDA
jgi:Uma2 family endonuclease